MEHKSGTSVRDLATRLACSSTSCCIADGLCLPMDMVKMRMQLQNELTPGKGLSVVSMTRHVIRNEGFLSLWAGLNAAAARQVTYGGLSFCAYPYVRDSLSSDRALWSQVVAGVVSGGVSAAIANPTDVVKVRLQADGRRAVRLYDGGIFSTLRLVLRQEGLRAMLNGIGPNTLRASVVNGVGIPAYDSSKALINLDRPLLERFLAACVGGVATSVAGTPFDVVKTRLMARGRQEQLYRSAFHCVVATVKTEGPLALWKGILPVYARQAPFNILNYLCMGFLLDTFTSSSH